MWTYGCDVDEIESDVARRRFVDVRETNEASAQSFVDDTKPLDRRTEKWMDMLSPFITQNALATAWGVRRLHMLDTATAARLLSRPVVEDKKGRLLDIGSGNGDVIARVSPLFSSTHVVEVSRLCRRALSTAPFVNGVWKRVDDIPTDLSYDVVTLLNVLDRCDNPEELLRAAVDKLTPNGQLIVSMTFPYAPFSIEPGDVLSKWTRPKRTEGSFSALLSETCAHSFEAFISRCVDDVFANHITCRDLDMTAVTRVPYLCQGSQDADNIYTMDCAVFVLRR